MWCQASNKQMQRARTSYKCVLCLGQRRVADLRRQAYLYMWRFLRRDVPRVRALKFFSVWPDAEPKYLDRPALVDGLLSMTTDVFGEYPQEFDIQGPYGISKGRSVGIKGFRSKLAKRGHEDYYGLDANSGGSFGFFSQLKARTGGGHFYDEVCVWFAVDQHQIDAMALARSVALLMPVDYGYITDFPSGYDLRVESPRKRLLFGGYALRETADHAHWRANIPNVLEGMIRDVYPYNFLNRRQVEVLAKLGIPEPTTLTQHMSALVFSDDRALQECRRRYFEAVPAA
jgi:hypothetical protein